MCPFPACVFGGCVVVLCILQGRCSGCLTHTVSRSCSQQYIHKHYIKLRVGSYKTRRSFGDQRLSRGKKRKKKNPPVFWLAPHLTLLPLFLLAVHFRLCLCVLDHLSEEFKCTCVAVCACAIRPAFHVPTGASLPSLVIIDFSSLS